jgi:hypothetical protein
MLTNGIVAGAGVRAVAETFPRRNRWQNKDFHAKAADGIAPIEFIGIRLAKMRRRGVRLVDSCGS